MIFDTSPPFDAPVRKGSRSEPEYFHNVQYERTKMVGVPDGEKKIKNNAYSLRYMHELRVAVPQLKMVTECSLKPNTQ